MDEENARLFFGDEPPEISWFDSQMQPCVDFERQGLYYALIEDTKTAFGKPYKALYALLSDAGRMAGASKDYRD